MEQLLRITSTPIKYELEVEHPKLEIKRENPSASVDTKPAKLTITNMKDTSVNISTYQARKSLGIMDFADFTAQNAAESQQALTKQIGEYVQIGNQTSQIQDGVTVGDIYRSKMLDSTNYQLYTAYLPSGGADLTWNPAQLDMNYQPGDVSVDWDVSANEFNFIPGSIRMKVTQLASVNIEYLGGPLYFPPSAMQKFNMESSDE